MTEPEPLVVWCVAASTDCYEMPYGVELNGDTRCARCPGGDDD